MTITKIPHVFPEINIDDDQEIENYIAFCENIFPKNKVKPKRTKRPRSWSDDSEKQNWEDNEIYKCIYGDEVMCGSMYFYYNYVRIKNLSGGIIRPEFRVSDNAWFETVESAFFGGENNGHGIVTVKRRRAGFTWKACALMLWKSIFFTGSRIGFDSKTETDSFKMMKDFVKYIYDGLPPFLKASTDGGNNKANITFSLKTEDEQGNTVFTGALSELYCKAPVDEAHEGEMLHLWVSDEAGKKSNLLTMWALTKPCMEQEGKLLGVPLLFGTAGDVDKGSYGLNELWKKCDAYSLIPFFFAGWMGMRCDEYGNDNIREAVMEIVKIRRAKSLSMAIDLFDYVQQYPLTPAEALKNSEVKGIGNDIEIDKRLTEIKANPPGYQLGTFRYGDPTKEEPLVVFERISLSDKRLMRKDFLYCTMWRDVNPDGVYDSGADPADHDHVQSKASNMSMYIVSRPQKETDKPKPVLKITGRPKLANDYYDQAIMSLLYYNEAKILIEKNRFGMINYFNTVGRSKLLKLEPIPLYNLDRKYIRRVGITKNAINEERFIGAVNDYTTDHCDQIDDPALLEEFSKYGEENTDEVHAFGWTLVSLQDSLRNKVSHKEVEKTNQSKLVIGKDGKVRRIK